MTSNELRESFLQFFHSKQHKIVPSAPMVVKNDPTLMFTNAGMNQFKDIFLEIVPIKHKRIVDSQKCLRVSGKHNDLEEVGHDTYHHTMFEMLGNWSFGNYFKKEAIDWAWELLVKEFKLEPERLYATIFEGDEQDNVDLDHEAKSIWQKYLPDDRIINGNKKDNFWEMGNVGPCGPCSEIHIDLRSQTEREKINGKDLINKDHPLVIEIWNLVFIQYNRKADGNLEHLPLKHVDTGMGFERLCMAMQGKTSNYDTDIFQPIIQAIANFSGYKYGQNEEKDAAMNVIADHLRTVAFSITDGQLPSNNKAGYVIRRILRRAIRYAFTFLDQKYPFIYKLLPALIDSMGEAYPELKKQKDLITQVIETEEKAFLQTLATGIKLLDQIIENTKKENKNTINGKAAFELYDTYGFPLDLTELILKEHGLNVDNEQFNKEMEAQKNRSRNDAATETNDWIVVKTDDKQEFVGYDYTEANVFITKYKKITVKGKTLYQIIFSVTPFYGESGGQVGDNGFIEANGVKTPIVDVKKEHNQIVHLVKELPENINQQFKAVVNTQKRVATQCNHSATHLLHYALRNVLGTHVEQKGSLVNDEHLRFDFSHFHKLTNTELIEVENMVNKMIRENYKLDEYREIPIQKAKNMGAMALFGEKYGDVVRVIKFGDSVELCGGNHVNATGKIGCFKIVSESSIAAGIRRIEAVTAYKAEKFINMQISKLNDVSELMQGSKNIVSDIKKLIAEKDDLIKKISLFEKKAQLNTKQELKNSLKNTNGMNYIVQQIEISSAAGMKDIAFQLKGEIDNLFLVLGADIDGKANLAVMISDNLVKEKNLHAGNIIKEIAKEIQGGGGGQPFFATAGGKNTNGIQNALNKAKEKLK